MKKISVIVTNFNHASYIAQALDSLKVQTYQNLEVILVDDGSTDSSREVVKAWTETNPGVISKEIWNEVNKGKWAVLNQAIGQASGDLITLQDADDVSCPQRLERQVVAMEKTKSWHSLCGFFHCYSQQEVDLYKNHIVVGGEDVPVMLPSEVTKLVYDGFRTPGTNHYFTGAFETHGATCLFHRQLWEHGMKFLPGNMGLRCQRAEDSDFNTKCTLLLQKTSVLCEKLYCYRRNTSTNSAYLENL